MSKSKKIVAVAIFLAIFCSSQVASAKNADVSHAPEILVIDGGTSHFASTFNVGQENDTFTDKFNFSIASSYKFAADLFALNHEFNITHFNLYNQFDNSVVARGSHGNGGGGNNEIWNLSLANLASGAYFLQVDGKLKSDNGPIFSGNLMTSPVPEAETYTMLLAGLGLICFLSRRRHVSEKFK